MIQIIDDWYVAVTLAPVNYVVRRGKGLKDKKGGWKDKPLGYFSSLRSAVKFIRNQIIAEGLSEASRTLSDAFLLISETDKKFDEITQRIEA